MIHTTLRHSIANDEVSGGTTHGFVPNSTLRPGLMLASSQRTEKRSGVLYDQYIQSTSGMLAVDQDGDRI